MIQRQDGCIAFSCDGCPDAIVTSVPVADSFEEAWAEARAYGWQRRERKGEWQHFCPDCKAKAVAA